MKYIYNIGLLIITSFFSLVAIAQTDPETAKERTEFKLGAYYNSNLNYYGRTDSLKSSGFFPVIEFWANKHFYLTAAPVFVNNRTISFEYAGTVATAGVRFGTENKSTNNIYLVKPIYKSNTQLVQSALNAQLIGSHTWLNKIINITIGGDVKLSDNLDYGLSGGLDHIIRFEFPGNLILVIDPSATINAGTQQFTKTSYKQSGILLLPGVQQKVNEDVKKLNILSYELSMPVVFAAGKLQVILNPAYVIPQNLITVTNRPDLSERGEKMFYTTIGLKVNF